MVPSRVGCGGFQLECFMDDHAFVLSCLRATLRRTLVSYAQWLIFFGRSALLASFARVDHNALLRPQRVLRHRRGHWHAIFERDAAAAQRQRCATAPTIAHAASTCADNNARVHTSRRRAIRSHHARRQ